MTIVKSSFCTACEETKAFDQFYAKSKTDRRPRSKCKACMKAYEKTRPTRYYPEAHARAVAKWLANNPGWSTTYQREHYRANADRINSRRKEWSAENGNKFLEYRNRRRALKAQAEGHHSLDEFARLCELFGNRCLRCGDAGSNLTQDHIVPLSKGGTDWIWNIQPLCRSCNASKGATIQDFRRLYADRRS